MSLTSNTIQHKLITWDRTFTMTRTFSRGISYQRFATVLSIISSARSGHQTGIAICHCQTNDLSDACAQDLEARESKSSLTLINVQT